MAASNQLDNEIKGRNVANALRRRFLEGNITSPPPIGYKMVKVNGKGAAVKDDEWYSIIQQLWHKVEDEHLTIRQAAQWLTGLGKRRFNRSSVEKILKNKFYSGTLVSAKYGEVEGKHDVMITKESYLYVRNMLTSKSHTHGQKTKLRDDFPVRGLVKCPSCGKNMTAAWSRNRHKQLYGYYFCTLCEQRNNTNKELLEDTFTEYLKSIKPTQEKVTEFCENLEEQYKATYETLLHSWDWVDKEIDMLIERLAKLEEKHLGGVYTDDDYVRIRDDIKIRLIAQKSLANEKKIDVLDIKIMTKVLAYYLLHFDQLFKNADPETRYLIGCSIFPKGFTFEDGVVRTPELGYCYKHINDFIPQMSTFVSRQGLEP